MKRKLIPLGIVLLGASIAAAWSLGLPAQLGWSENEPEGELTLYGNVDVRQVQLGFRVGGRIAQMFVDEGDSVEPGMVLARLDAEPFEQVVQGAAAAVAAQRATLAKLVAGPRAAEIDQARAVLAERSAERRNSQREFERSRQLQSSGVIPNAEADQAQAAFEMATAREASARETLRLLQQGSRSEDVSVARANLDAAEANSRAARTALEDTFLRAPEPAVVTTRVREPGTITAPGETVYALVATQPIWVRAYIPEPQLGKIRPGMTVSVVSDSAPDRPYEGRVGFISSVAEFTPKSVETPELRTDLVYRRRVIIDGGGSGLRQGMPVTLRVPVVQPQPGASS